MGIGREREDEQGRGKVAGMEAEEEESQWPTFFLEKGKREESRSSLRREERGVSIDNVERNDPTMLGF
jgi:hypothetical protein